MSDDNIHAVIILLIVILIVVLYNRKLSSCNEKFDIKPDKNVTIYRDNAEGVNSYVRLYQDWDGTQMIFESENPLNASMEPGDIKYFKDHITGQVRTIDINILPSSDADRYRGVKIWAYYPNSNNATTLSMQYETNPFYMPEHRLNAYAGFTLLADVKPGQHHVVQVNIPVKKIFMVARI